MFKSQTPLFFGMILFLFSFQGVNAQGTFSVTTNIGQDVLNFGLFTSGTNSGEITVDINGNYNPVPTGGITTLPFGPAPRVVTITVNTPNNGKSVTVSPVSTVLTGPNSSKINLDLIYSIDSFFATNNPKTITVGGKLTIPKDIQEGIYTGTISIPVTLHNN